MSEIRMYNSPAEVKEALKRHELSNPLLARAMQMHNAGQMTYEQTIEVVVVLLIEQNNEFMRQLQDVMDRSLQRQGVSKP